MVLCSVMISGGTMNKKHNENNENNPFAEENSAKDELKQENELSEQTVVEGEDSQELNKIKEDFDSLNNQYVRLAADFDNYRKRQAQERESLLKYGTEEALKKLIEVLDNFERAKQSLISVDDCTKLRETFDILHKQTVDSLTKLGLEVIETQGQKFNPEFHEAVMQTQTDEFPEETIIKELQKGYKLADKVLRAALVDVAVQ